MSVPISALLSSFSVLVLDCEEAVSVRALSMPMVLVFDPLSLSLFVVPIDALIVDACC
jgi:hypothetical protein